MLQNETMVNVLNEIGIKAELPKNNDLCGVDDAVLVEYAAERGWAVLSRDKGIRPNPLAAQMVYRNRGILLQLAQRKERTPEGWAEILRLAKNKLLKTLEEPPPFIARIKAGGLVERVEEEKINKYLFPGVPREK